MGTQRLRARARRIATIAETNLTIWMLAQSVHAARITSVDVHQASGNETIASLCVARNASGNAGVDWSNGSAGKAITKSAAAQHTTYRTLADARSSENSIRRNAAATTPPCHSQFSAASISRS